MNYTRILVKLLFIFSVIITTNGYRILGIFPMNSKSHNNMFEALMKGLEKVGHEVDVISHFELKNPPKNYKTIINLNGTTPVLVNNLTFENAAIMGNDPIPYIADVIGSKLCELMGLEEMQKIIKNPPPYDAVITEAFSANCYFGFGYVLKVPVIAVSTILEFPWAVRAIGNPASTAFVQNVFMDSVFISTFWDRLKNTIIFHIANYRFYMYAEKVQTEAMRKYLSPDIPDLREVEKNVALMLTNNYHSLFGIRPVTPAVVDIAGIHAEENEDRFTPEMKRWMDDSHNGVVFFSLGSMVIVESLPTETLLEFYRSFSKIAPTRVLMKIVNKDKLPPGLPENVLVSSWIPQVPVLKHNKTKVFITHGGLMSTQEALYYGVPMIGIPLFTDQFSNVEIYVRKNMAIRIDYDKINEESLYKSLSLILNDPKFKEAARRESGLFRYRPMSAMRTAIFWIEYVIRNGENSLRSPAVDLYWFQIELLDVYGFLIFTFAIFIYLFIFILKLFVLTIFKILRNSPSSSKKRD
ncbi:UDP-glucuronosyltransferase 2B31-like isoform X1 [Belonocnema kinseyi]|uniref:UDP-glucuronosyltransferase 2B31-like isoform X1 n=1 Tax=Belonocnema kinseyi TaxID=2817044 RepID=UPI00143D491B|nr:UDP-glucuronosyltransferase 2B31-like isoform X1 [Belonocnema kinseyi]